MYLQGNVGKGLSLVLDVFEGLGGAVCQQGTRSCFGVLFGGCELGGGVRVVVGEFLNFDVNADDHE